MHAVRDALPGEDIIYYGDCLYAPYGDRNSEYIKERCLAIGRFLISKGAKAIVVSCNTATAEGVNTMRDTFDIPIIGIEPAIKPAAAATKTGVVGVIATTRTITSERYLRLVREFAGTKVKVVSVPCPGLMECVESGDWDSFKTQKLIEKYLHPIKRAGADKLVLGCTHYPFLSNVLKRDSAAEPNSSIQAQQLPENLNTSSPKAAYFRMVQKAKKCFISAEMRRSIALSSSVFGTQKKNLICVLTLPQRKQLSLEPFRPSNHPI